MSPDRQDVAADIAIIGSGPGGALTACLLAEAGRDVLLVEEGENFSQASCPPFSALEMQQKYRNGGITATIGATRIAYVEACCGGGGSEVNSALWYEAGPAIFDRWQRERGVRELGSGDLAPHYAAIAAELGIRASIDHSPAARKLMAGAERLGWRTRNMPRWVRAPAPGAGGDAFARRSMTESYLPRAAAAGCRFLFRTRAVRIRPDRQSWVVDVLNRAGTDSPTRQRIRAQAVFVAAGAIQTPTLLRRSGLGGNVGNSLHLHPMLKVIGLFPDAVHDDSGGVAPMQVDEFSPRFLLGCSISTLPHLAFALRANPADLALVNGNWRRMAAFNVMTQGGAGTIRPLPGFRDPLVRYALADGDFGVLAEGLRRLAEALLAAGAEAVYPGIPGLRALRTAQDLARIPAQLPAAGTGLSAVHLLASCPMGEPGRGAATDSWGRLHGCEGLYVADASLLPGPLGGNPQATLMAIVRRNARHFLGAPAS